MERKGLGFDPWSRSKMLHAWNRKADSATKTHSSQKLKKYIFFNSKKESRKGTELPPPRLTFILKPHVVVTVSRCVGFPGGAAVKNMPAM